MAKRKAASLLTPDESPVKRVTRSTHLLEKQMPIASLHTPRTPPKIVRTYGSRSRIKQAPTPRTDNSQLKENEGLPERSEDELNLSPSKRRRHAAHTRSPSSVPRMILDAVEIPVTPKRRLRGTISKATSPVAVENVRTETHSKGAPRVDAASPSPSKSHITPQDWLPPNSEGLHASTSSHSMPHHRRVTHAAPSSPYLPQNPPFDLDKCLLAQKTAILKALNDLSEPQCDISREAEFTGNIGAYDRLTELLVGTVARNEGNSCLILGPRGSGKTKLVERCVESLPESPIVVRLSGWAQYNDRLAMREMARQLSQQTGSTFLAQDVDEAPQDTDNPFYEGDYSVSLPPPSHLPALVSILPTLSRSTIVILDAFDLFAQHARQSLLYCLLDTAQSCRAGRGDKGLAVIGVTSRIDSINLLEKRVKSRFSGRMLLTFGSQDFKHWLHYSKAVLTTKIDDPSGKWRALWDPAVETFLSDPKVIGRLNETFSLTRDFRMLGKMLITAILELGSKRVFPTAEYFTTVAWTQRSRTGFSHLHELSYPSVCLLIAATHARTAGHDTVTFEQLHECFRVQVRTSASAPVQIGGAGIGMMGCQREMLVAAFENLISARWFVAASPSSSIMAREFVRYRCTVHYDDVKSAVDKMGHTSLKKWFSKAQ